jgi:calcium uniporter protein, mitochondrial
VTYLSGLSTVICGYLWFLYQGREVSYSSVLSQSISTRRAMLYNKRGLDIDRFIDLLAEQKAIRREVGRIAEDYGVKWEWSDVGEDEEDDGKEALKPGKDEQKKEDGKKLKKADEALDEEL